MAKKKLEDCPPETLAEEIVVVRVDYNLPLDKHGEVVDDTRLVRTLPTIQYLVEAGAKAVLLSHLGRPGGRTDPALSPVRSHVSSRNFWDPRWAFVQRPPAPSPARPSEG